MTIESITDAGSLDGSLGKENFLVVRLGIGVVCVLNVLSDVASTPLSLPKSTKLQANLCKLWHYRYTC